ncbi:hypothetical protein SDC9_201688 [bioreactor metagenome]|uniref:Uncharacterized protein n=1 Tax=bioreactor metagenome TaxID=1076179 RepID=A0A645IUD1_9ZZZZ
MGDFFFAGRPHFHDRAGEHQGGTGQGMVAVEHHLVAGDVGNAVDDEIVIAAVFRAAFELHADLEFLRKILARLDLDHLGVVFAKGLVRLQLDLNRLADLLALQRFLDFREDVVVTTMQVNQRLAAFINHLAIRILDVVIECNNGVLRNQHVHSVAFLVLMDILGNSPVLQPASAKP